MADGKLDTGKLVKLLATAKDLHEKQGELLEEIDAILGGRAAIGDKLKAFERGFDAAWCARYAPGQHGRYVWRYVQDRPNMKRLLKAIELEDLIARAGRYVRSDEPFYAKARHNFGLFVSSINSWASAADAPGGFELEGGVAGCKHTPACRSDQEHTRRSMAEMRR